MTQKIIISLLVLHLFIPVYAHNYHEHRRIGNLAYNRAINHMNWVEVNQYLQLQFDETNNHWYFLRLSRHPNQISYGTLNALSGDHVGSPLQLIDNLMYSYSNLNRIVLLQDEYGEQFFTNAHNGKLYKADKTYGSLALTNFNHFYHYGYNFMKHLSGVRKELIQKLINPAEHEKGMEKLAKTNAIQTYITLHAAAVELAREAGSLVKNNQMEEGKKVLFYAIVFNAYADHFLQDAFAAGHLIVQRTWIGGLTNNKAMHDFYNSIGLKVLNLKGEVWKTNGDNSIFLPNRNLQNTTDFASISSISEDSLEKVQHVVRAVEISILEVFAAFAKAKEEATDLLANIPDKHEKAAVKEAFYLEEFKSLSCIPIPFGSKLERYGFKGKDLKSLKEINRMPFYRNYVRSRVSHSLTLGFGRRLYNFNNGVKDAGVYPSELRYRVGLNGYKYKDRPKKAGTIDRWNGISVAYLFSGKPQYDSAENKLNASHQIKVGYNQIFDLWFINNSFIGIHQFFETGIDIRGREVAWILSPSVGIQLLPFAAGIWGQKNVFSKAGYFMLRLLLDQKFLFSYQYITGNKSRFYITSEFDISF